MTVNTALKGSQYQQIFLKSQRISSMTGSEQKPSSAARAGAEAQVVNSKKTKAGIIKLFFMLSVWQEKVNKGFELWN
jgi:hypothetical protein